MPKPFFPSNSKPPLFEAPGREEESKLNQMTECYLILKSFFLTVCVILCNLRIQADGQGQTNVPLLKCLARPETRKVYVLLFLCLEHCLTLFVQTGVNFRHLTLREAVKTYLRNRFGFKGYGWGTFINRSCPPLVKTGKGLAKHFARYQAVKGGIDIMNQLFMHDFSFEHTAMDTVYEYAGTSLTLDEIIHGLERDIPKLELICTFSRVFLDNLEPDVGIGSMTHVLLRVTPKRPGPTGPTVASGFLIKHWAGQVDFSTLYYFPSDSKRKICEDDEKGKKRPKIDNPLAPGKVMEDPVWSFIQQVEKKFSNGQYVPVSLADWLGYRVNVSSDEILDVFTRYCSNRTPSPELLALYLTHQLLSSNEGRTKRAECSGEGKSKGKMACSKTSFQPPTSLEIKLPAVEVSIPSGEELIGDCLQLSYLAILEAISTEL